MFKNFENNEVSEMVAVGFIEENCYTAKKFQSSNRSATDDKNIYFWQIFFIKSNL